MLSMTALLLLLSRSISGLDIDPGINCMDVYYNAPVNLTSCQVAISDFETDPHFKEWPIPARETIFSEGGGEFICGFGIRNNATTDFSLNVTFVADMFEKMYNQCAVQGLDGNWTFPGGEQFLLLESLGSLDYRKRADSSVLDNRDAQVSCDSVDNAVALKEIDCVHVIASFTAADLLYLPAGESKFYANRTCAGSVENMQKKAVNINSTWLKQHMTNLLVDCVVVNGSGGSWSDGHKAIDFYSNSNSDS